jgi:hypothetical protein
MKRVRVTEELAYGGALDRLTGSEQPARTPPKAKVKETVPEPETNRIKLSVFLNRGEDAYLESLASTAKFSGGRKLSKTRLIEAMVKAFRTSGLDVRGVRTDEELLNRVVAQMRK